MTDLDVSAIEHRLNAATPGPWHVDEPATYDPQEVGICAENGDVRLAFTGWDRFVVCYGNEENPKPGHSVALANATFIAHARTDIFMLLDMVHQLRQELEFFRDDDMQRIVTARRAGAEAMRVAICSQLKTHWDKGVVSIAANVPVPEHL